MASVIVRSGALLADQSCGRLLEPPGPFIKPAGRSELFVIAHLRRADRRFHDGDGLVIDLGRDEEGGGGGSTVVAIAPVED